MARSIKNETIVLQGGLSRRDALKLAGVAGITAASLSAFGVRAAFGQEGTGSVVGGFGNAVLGLDPHTVTQVGGFAVMSYVFEGLYRIELESAETVPSLLTGEIEKTGDLTYRGTIRSGATFHDGSPLTASDVVFSFDRMRGAELGSFAAQYLAFINTVSALDDTTVEFTLNSIPGSEGILKQRFAMVKIMSEADTLARDANAISLMPMGSGPYSLSEHVSGERILLTKHATYGGPLPQTYDEIDFRFILDGSARVAALRTGQVAAIEEVPYPDMATLAGSGFETASLQSFTMSLLEFNCGKAPFDDQRVRQAVLYAINRDQITQAVFLGSGSPAVSYFPENHPYFTRPETVYTQNLEKAQELLAAAGMEGFGFELMISDQAWILPQGELIQAQLAQAGINATLRPGETESLYAFVADGSFESYLAFTDPSVFSPDPDLLLRWVYTGTLARALWHWDNAQTDRVEQMINDALTITDEAALKQAYADILEAVAQACPAYPLHHRMQPSAWTSGTAGFVPLPRTGLSFLDGK